MKRIVFYQINEKFITVFHHESLKVFLELKNRAAECDNVKKQFELFIENIQMEGISSLLFDRFHQKNSFEKKDNNVYILKNEITNDVETLTLDTKSIRLEYEGRNSQFLDFISLYFPAMVAINEGTNEIVALETLTNLCLI